MAEYEDQFKSDRRSAEDVRGEGNDSEGHQARVLLGTEEIRRNFGKVGAIINEMIADDGPVPMDWGESRHARCENDANIKGFTEDSHGQQQSTATQQPPGTRPSQTS